MISLTPLVVWHAILLVIGITSYQHHLEIYNFFAMKTSAALAGGLAGTVTVASIHEALRRVTPNAPRMDLLDMELMRKGLKRMNKKIPDENELQRWAVGSELICDTAYYGLAGMGG